MEKHPSYLGGVSKLRVELPVFLELLADLKTLNTTNSTTNNFTVFFQEMKKHISLGILNC